MSGEKRGHGGVVTMMRMIREGKAVPDSVRSAARENMACIFLHRGCRLRWYDSNCDGFQSRQGARSLLGVACVGIGEFVG